MKRPLNFNVVILLAAFFFVTAEAFAQSSNFHPTNRIDYKVKLDKGDAEVYLGGNCAVGDSCGSGLEIDLFDDKGNNLLGGRINCSYREYTDDFGYVAGKKAVGCRSADRVTLPQTGTYIFSVTNTDLSRAKFVLNVFQTIAGDKRHVVSESIILEDLIRGKANAAQNPNNPVQAKAPAVAEAPKGFTTKKYENGCVGYNGVWKNVKPSGQLTLSVNGNKAEGTFILDGASGTFSGEVGESYIQGTYREMKVPNTRTPESGDIRFVLTETGFLGWWWKPDGYPKFEIWGTCIGSK